MENKINGWKITAIIFLILFILETLLFAGFVYLGYKGLQEEEKYNLDKEYCAINICTNGGYQSFSYIQEDSTCYCYMGDEIEYAEIIK